MTNLADTGCQRLKRLIGVFEAEIKLLDRVIDAAEAQLAKLQAAPKSDPEKIKAAKQELTKLRAQLKGARQRLIETKEDFFENCS